MHENDEHPYWLNQKFLINLLESLPSHVFWKDREGVYLGCNTHFARSLGLKTPSDVIGKNDYDLPTCKEDSDTYRANDQEVMLSQRAKLNIEEKQCLSNGKEVFLLTNKAPLFDNENKVVGVLGIYSDITELKNTQLSLLESKKQAESASKAKSEFIANMSHDLRTPITGIIGMIQNLLNTVEVTENSLQEKNFPSSEERKLLDELTSQVKGSGYVLMDSVDSLLHLCNEILEITRLENGLLDQLTESFDVYDLVQHNIELLKPVSLSKNLPIITDIDNNVPQYLEGFMGYTNRILLNLISNSLKFTQTGQVTVNLKLLAEDEQTNYKKGDIVKIQLKIKDTGIGIPRDKFDDIFKQFSRLTPSYDGIYQGSGLGLYMVKKYVKRMNGHIWLESEVGRWTCFTIILPFMISDKVNKIRTSSNHFKKKAIDSISLSDNSDISLHQILVVEDSVPAAVAVKFALKPLHCTIDFASSGREAIDKVKNNTYNLILMDIGLPDMSGIEAAREIRALGDNEKAQVPIVALTGHADTPEMRKECLESGMQDVLSKPTQTKILESVLEEYVICAKAKEKDSQSNNEKFRSSDETIIDWDECIRKSYGDESAASEMLSILSDDLTVTLTTLEKYYLEKNIKKLRAELHRVLGGVVYVCLPNLEKRLRTFHDVIQLELFDLEKLEYTYKDLKDAINEFKEEWTNRHGKVDEKSRPFFLEIQGAEEFRLRVKN